METHTNAANLKLDKMFQEVEDKFYSGVMSKKMEVSRSQFFSVRSAVLIENLRGFF